MLGFVRLRHRVSRELVKRQGLDVLAEIGANGFGAHEVVEGLLLHVGIVVDRSGAARERDGQYLGGSVIADGLDLTGLDRDKLDHGTRLF